MSKLFKRALVKKENAEYDYIRINVDDAYLDDCCYNLQQCIEYCMKYIIEQHGYRYEEKHDIRLHLNTCKDVDINYPIFNNIRTLASTLNEWNVDSRYNDNFLALIEDIEEARDIANELIKICKQLEPKEIN